MARSLTPLARAVVMKSCCIAWLMPSRVRRATLPAKYVPNVIAGRITCHGPPQSPTGNTGHLTPSNTIKIGPNTNAGMHTARMEKKLPR